MMVTGRPMIPFKASIDNTVWCASRADSADRVVAREPHR
jgi:hypothetical protein